MSFISWDLSVFGAVPQTGTINLGTISEAEYYEKPLLVTGNTGPTTFTVIAGRLPPGLQVNRSGLLYGNPIVTDINSDINDITLDAPGIEADNSRPYLFTIRASDSLRATDKTFTVTINNIRPPKILPRVSDGAVNLGIYEDGSQIDYQFIAYEDNPSADLIWELAGGDLPTGLSLSTSGQLTGYLMPNPPSPLSGTSDKGGWDDAYWDENIPQGPDGQIPWDFVGLREAAVFQFTVSVYDGESYDKVTYIMSVYPKGSATADSTLYTADLIHVSADSTTQHHPVILNSSHFLPDTRQLSYVLYKFNAIDFDQVLTGNPTDSGLRWEILTLGNGRFDEAGYEEVPFDLGQPLPFPVTLTLDENTGWLYGTMPSQIEETLTYTFNIRVYKIEDPSYFDEQSFSLRVLGNLIDLVQWVTPSDLGQLENQEISELKLETLVYEPVLADYLIAANLGGEVVSPNVDTVSYFVDSGSLPTGLELQTNGLITGRVGFDYFMLDSGTTTIDNNDTLWDSTYTFTANAVGFDSNANIVVSTTRDFTISVSNINIEPFSDIYIKAHLPADQRLWFRNLLADESIFPSELIYRSIDPHFGKTQNVKVLFDAGVKSTDMYQVALGMQTNHYKKKILFGDIKTAIAVDDDFNPKYEVVYVELIDELVNKSGESIKQSISVAGKVQQGYLTHNRDQAINEPSVYQITEHTVLKPNSFKTMSKLVTDSIGFSNKAAMPDWMSSLQPDGTIVGFTRALVLCYLISDSTKAPKFNANMVASRLRKHFTDNNISLNQLEFVADRYQIDLNLENYPDIDDKYLSFPSLGVFI